MDNSQISYQDTGYYSKIILDYLEQKNSVSEFYNRFPSLTNLKLQIEEKKEFYKLEQREVLVNSLKAQYEGLETTTLVKNNIDSLSKENTFTITTGHQLNLFSGPIYFLYKIISVLNLCKQLKETYPTYNFVPIYWMASEDHDFEEIQSFNFKKNKILWDRESSGPVGRLSTDGLENVFDVYSKQLNSGKNAEELRELFKHAYLKHSNLSLASRYLVNALFQEQGVVVVDGDDAVLKQMFKPYAKKELEEQVSYKNITETNISLTAKEYHIQVNPRETNLFYITNSFRERIIKEGDKFKVNNTNLIFNNVDEVFKNTKKKEFVSGNALLRPLYQEVILPNLCYIGGGGELAYWLQLKSTFKAFKVPFPVLLIRNSALLVSEKQEKKLGKIGLGYRDLFLKKHDLSKVIVNKKSNLDFNFQEKRDQLKSTFRELEQLISLTDKSFEGAVSAQKKKQLKGLDNLEKRLLTAEKRRLKDVVSRSYILQDELFPNGALQERYCNFSEFYEAYGKGFIKQLLELLDPLNVSFSIINVDKSNLE